MARRITAMATLSPTATGDAANLVDNTYPHTIQGGSATQLINIWEVSITGQAPSSSSPTLFLLGYDVVVGTGTNTRGAGQTDTNMNPATAALALPAVTGNQWATTKPQRGSGTHLANASLNAFGGNYFWRANRVEECFVILGNAVPSGTNNGGEVSLSAFTGGTPGLCGSHIIYEPL